MPEQSQALDAADAETEVESQPADPVESASTDSMPDAEPAPPPEAATDPGPGQPSSQKADRNGEQPADAEEPEAEPPEAAAPDEEVPATATPEEAARGQEISEPLALEADAAAEGPPETATAETATPDVSAAKVAEAPSEAPRSAGEIGEDVAALLAARDEKTPVEGTVFGWNDRGFHVVIRGLTAFCPGSEMELGATRAPASYVDQSFPFRILRIQGKGRRVVVSRAAVLREEKAKRKAGILAELEAGGSVEGEVSSITDFGAFVDLGGVEGLVHISEICRQRIDHPSEILAVGQKVQVKVLKIEKKGRRISLSIKALEADPWQAVARRFPSGAEVKGKVEKTMSFGAFIELEPGLTGLLPTSEMGLARGASPGRAYPVGREVSVQVAAVDPKRRRISLTLCGSKLEGSRTDYLDYVKKQRKASRDGMNAMAAAFKKLQNGS